jgi:hypothetical protein
LAPSAAHAQFTAETAIESNGVRIFIRPRASIEKIEGWAKVTLDGISSRVDAAYGVVVDGERAGYGDFGGQLESYFNAIEVRTLSATFFFDGGPGCTGQVSDAAWSEGESSTASCRDGASPRLTRYSASGLSTSGVLELAREVRRLRREARQAEQAANRPAPQPRPGSGSGSSSSGSAPSGSSSSGSSGSGSSGNSSGARPEAARPSSTPSAPPPPSTADLEKAIDNFANTMAKIAADRAAAEEAAEEARERRRLEAEAAEARRVANVEQSRRRFIAMLQRDRSAAVAAIQALTTARQRVLTDVERAKTYRERPTERWAFIVATRPWAEPRWPASVDESAFSWNDDSGHESAYRSRSDSYANAASSIATETIMISRPFLIRPDVEGFYPLTAPMIAKFQRQNAGFTNVEVLGWYTREQAEALYARTAERVQQCRCRVTLTRTVFVP